MGVCDNVIACRNISYVKKLIHAYIVGKKNDRNKRKLEKQLVQEEPISKPQQEDFDSADDENGDGKKGRRVMRVSRNTFREQKMHRSYRQLDVGSSQTERNIRGRSKEGDDDFEIRAVARIDSCMQKRRQFSTY